MPKRNEVLAGGVIGHLRFLLTRSICLSFRARREPAGAKRRSPAGAKRQAGFIRTPASPAGLQALGRVARTNDPTCPEFRSCGRAVCGRPNPDTYGWGRTVP